MPLASSTPATREKPPRKRNVVSRGRTGCLTCRRRRLKCDETKPGCNNCRRVKVECEGYAQKITFKDQTNFIVERAQGKSTRRKGQAPSDTIKDETEASDTAFEIITTPYSAASASPELHKKPVTPTLQPSEYHNYQLSTPQVQEGSHPDFPSTPTSLTSQAVSKTQSHHGSSGRNLSPVSDRDSDRDTVAYKENVNSVEKGYMTPCSPVSMDFKPSPSRVISNSFLCLAGAFEFPEDYTYYEYSTAGQFSSIAKVLPLSELFKAEPVSPHVYNAALALSALTLSSHRHNPRGSIPLRRHAFHHCLKAVQGLQNELSHTPHSGLSDSLGTDAALSFFATTMLLANFELQRGCLLTWRSHMYGAALCLNSGYRKIVKKTAGMLLIKAFARMALLLRLYNEEYSVTTPEVMAPKLANWLNLLLRQSSFAQDKILLMMEEITQLEIQKRQDPTLDHLWSEKSDDLLRRLEEWGRDLPNSEIPVEDTSNEAYLTISSPDEPYLIRVSALYFPDSPDPCASAVNYATYLCTGMRARTRYLPDARRILPPGVEQTALTICRIAASIPPARFGESFTYSQGMLPSVVGAYRWSTNAGLRSWVRHWLAGYTGSREGIWNVNQTLRLIASMDRQFPPSSGQHFVAVRMVDEPTDPSPELEEGCTNEPFKIQMYTRDGGGISKKLVDVD